MRIAMMATGGIGGYLAVRLVPAGHEIVCIARGAHLDAIRAAGLRLDGPDGTHVVHPALVTDNPEEAGPVDAVIFGVKGTGLETAARACLPLLGPDTVLVPFLNGVEAAERIAGIVPAAHVADGVAYVSTTITAPGVIGQTGAFSRYLFGERDNTPSDRILALRAAFREAGLEAPDVADIDKEIWTKFIMFSAMSGVTTAGRCRIAQVRAHSEMTDLFRTVMEETAALARARGVAADADIVDRHMEFFRSLPDETRASTAVDLEKGAPLETPWINGAVARLGAQAEVATPANATLAAVLAPHVDGLPQV